MSKSAQQAELDLDPLIADWDALLARDDVAGQLDGAKWPATLAELVDVATAHFTRRGAAAETARREAQAVIILLAHHFGGRMSYLPRDARLRLALRDNLIWQEFGGANVAALAERYDLTEQQIYNILREQRTLTRDRAQRRLFD